MDFDPATLAAWLRGDQSAQNDPNAVDLSSLPNSQGGSFTTGLANALVSGATLPGDVATGKADIRLPSESPDLTRVADLAGLAMTGGLAGGPEGALGSGPIRAYHGSPHDFDRFDLSKIGTGEGAQVYGHGLYFAENPETAQAYRDALSTGRMSFDGVPLDKPLPHDASPELKRARYLFHGYASPDDAVASIHGDIWRAKQDGDLGLFDQARNQLEEIHGLLPRISTNGPGHMYEVAIHADPERFLDWDKPLSAHPRDVQEALTAVPGFPQRFERVTKLTGSEPTGAGAYDIAAQGLHDWSQPYSHVTGRPAATEALSQAGIPGIKYLDQGSRAAGVGSRNYVTFSDKIVEIMRKYGVASFAALPPAIQMMLQGSGSAPSGDLHYPAQ